MIKELTRISIILCAIGTTNVRMSARAETYNVPQKGGPLMVAVIPSNWTVSYNEVGGLFALAHERQAALLLDIIKGTDIADDDMSLVAAKFFRGAAVQTYDRDGTGSIANVVGKAFLGKTISPHGAPLDMRAVFVWLDAQNVLVMTTIREPGLATAEEAALEGLISHVQIVGCSRQCSV
jgi:hypothetical protein